MPNLILFWLYHIISYFKSTEEIFGIADIFYNQVATQIFLVDHEWFLEFLETFLNTFSVVWKIRTTESINIILDGRHMWAQ